MNGGTTKSGYVRGLKLKLRRGVRLRDHRAIRQPNHEVGVVIRLVSVVTRSKVVKQHRSGHRRVSFARTEMFKGIGAVDEAEDLHSVGSPKSDNDLRRIRFIGVHR